MKRMQCEQLLTLTLAYVKLKMEIYSNENDVISCILILFDTIYDN